MSTDVQALLAAARQPWQAGFRTRAAQLPPQFTALVPGLLKGEHETVTTAIQELGELLHRDPGSVPLLARVFFPTLADTAERTIQALLTRHAYPQGHQRRAFRAPGHPLQAQSAAHWVWQVWTLTREYPQPLLWFAVHAGLLSAWTAQRLGLLFAQALDDGDEAVFGVLRDTAGSQHPLARMGRHVPVALLASSRPDAWALAEGLLLAAQRQEGLRQVILESVDEAHPQAFIRTLRLILSEDLLRFAAALRAADVWFGLDYDVTETRAVRALLTRALAFLEDPARARAALTQGPPQEAYAALFTLGMHGAVEAAALSRPLLTHPEPERRMAAAQFLLASDLMEAADTRTLYEDPDTRLSAVAWATRGTGHTDGESGEEPVRSFGRAVTFAARLPAAGTHEPLLFPWLGRLPARGDVLDTLPPLLDARPLAELRPFLGGMTLYGRTSTLRQMTERGTASPLDAPTRELLMELLQDRNTDVSQEAVKVAQTLTLERNEVEVVRGLLKRKGADLRRGLIRLLVGVPDALSHAEALLSTRNTEQRQAGLQLLLELGGTLPPDFGPKGASEAMLAGRLQAPQDALTLDNGLGLFDPARLSPLPEVQFRAHDYAAGVRRGAELLTSLDAFVVAHAEDPVTGESWDGQETVLLGTLGPRQLLQEPYPFADLWARWWAERPGSSAAIPAAGDLTRMGWALHHFEEIAAPTREEEWLLPDENENENEDDEDEDEDESGETGQEPQALSEAQVRDITLRRMFGPEVPLRLEYAPLLPWIVAALERHGPGAPGEAPRGFTTETGHDTDLALDAWETGLHLLPADVQVLVDPRYSWHRTDPRGLLDFLEPRVREGWDSWTPAQQERFWQLSVYADRAFPQLPRARPALSVMLPAEERGWADRADLLDRLIGPRTRHGYSGSGQFGDLNEYTRRRLRDRQPVTDAWLQAVGDVRARVLEVETARGDLETPATGAANALQSVEGAELPLTLLASLGKAPLRRGYLGHSEARDATFSHLIRVSYPLPSDTAQAFGTLVAQLKLPESRLLDLAMFAPQWAPLVSAVLGWPGLQGAVLWVHAHTRDGGWSVPQEVRDAWEADVSERTRLTGSELLDGAVDVAWFRDVYAQLGAERFARLLEAARYASSSGGHKRAELFARAVLGEEQEEALLARIRGKRQQDALRALGLLPLPEKKGQKGRERAVEARYRVIQEFRRGARQFGAQRQASERLAADVALQNLARTAGYSDPQRLTWAMEARFAPEWREQVNEGDVNVRIELTPDGEAGLRVRRGQKVLKSVPAALGKHPGVLALRSALAELEATRKRMRVALEEAMVRGEHFTREELAALSDHPVIAPMLRSLVWVLNEGQLGLWRGETQTLDTLDGAPTPISQQALRLAHPHDLYLSGRWSEWQRRVLEGEIVQPFKQVFREYYPLTAGETEARRSVRYAGHRVQPAKAAALLKARGWVTVPEEGVRKTFHAEGLNVWVDSALGYGTPGEVEGTPLEGVYFMPRDPGPGAVEALPLAGVPPRLLSEVLRDLDLVVSVAHVGGVDPEASQSTVEMRTALLTETLRLLKLGNVRLDHGHALIQGEYGQYSVQLGSGTVHRLPGGFLCLIPVHNQQQGRVFLPFADPDPRTAEVVSKVLLLAEDRKILDPTILEQLR